MSELLCGKHNRQKECIGGASAHISNWYCPDCDAEIDAARNAMTPLEIKIMLHYYTNVTDYREGDFSAPAVREAINRFRDEAGLLSANDPKEGKDTAYSLTEKGKFYVEYLCSVPLPITRYVIEQGV